MNEKEVFEAIGFDTDNLEFDANGQVLSTAAPVQASPSPDQVPDVVNREVIQEIVRGVLAVQDEMASPEPTEAPSSEPTAAPTALPTETPTEIPLVEKPISNFSNSEVFESVGLSILCILVLVLLFSKFWR